MFSEWHKIDLHIHTDKSKETKANDYRGVFDVDVLSDRLKENSVEMISLSQITTLLIVAHIMNFL